MPRRSRVRPYLVTVHPDSRWWHIRVPELDIVSQALTLREVPAQSRDLIALWQECPPDRIRVIVRRRGGIRAGWTDARPQLGD
jgi:hypothetical protein